jgi:Cell division GTPase
VSEVLSNRTKQQRGIFGGFKKNIEDKLGTKKESNEEVLMGEDRSAKIVGLVRRAMLGRLTLPCDYSTAERALVLVAGPPDEMDRKGVEKAKSWVEENIAGVEVRGGDYPVNSEYVAAVVMLATVGNAPRIKELLDIAKETKEEVIKSKEKKSNMFEEGIEPLFE